MIYVIYGAMGAVCTLALLLLGGLAGYRFRALLSHTLPPKGAGETAGEEQTAFEEMLRYNLQTAYGMGEEGDSL